MFLVPRKNAHIDNVWLVTSVALHLRVATNKWLKRSFESMDSSKCSSSRNAVLLVFSTRPTLRVYGWFVLGRVQCIVWYSANDTHLTLWQLFSNELHMLHFGSHQTLGYKIRRQKRERRLLQSFKVDYVCNVVVVFKTAICNCW